MRRLLALSIVLSGCWDFAKVDRCYIGDCRDLGADLGVLDFSMENEPVDLSVPDLQEANIFDLSMPDLTPQPDLRSCLFSQALCPMTTTPVTLAGSSGAFGTNNGSGSVARFNHPLGITFDGIDTLYVADYGNSAIRSVSISTAVVSTLIGDPSQRATTDGTGGLGGTARFNYPTGIVFVPGSPAALYVTENNNPGTVRKVTLSSPAVATTVLGTNPADGGTVASLNVPQGITYANGNLYVCESSANAIRQIPLNTLLPTQLANTAGHSMNVWSITYSNPYLYYVATGTASIYRYDISGSTDVQIAGYTSGSRVDGPSFGAQFAVPNLVVAIGDTIYVGEGSESTIRQISNGRVSTLVDIGTIPLGMAADNQGNLFVTTEDHRIIRLQFTAGCEDLHANTSCGFCNQRCYTGQCTDADAGTCQ